MLVDREVIGYAVALADATRHPAEHGLQEIASLIEFGASPRGPIGLVQAARVLALLRGRGHVAGEDIRDLAADVLRHRIVLSYDALSEGVTADELLEQVLAAVPEPGAEHLIREAPTVGEGRVSTARLEPPAARQGPGPMPRPLVEALDVAISRLIARTLAGRPARGRGRRSGPSSRSCARTRSATTCATSTPPPPPAPASRTCACTCPSAR